MVPDRQLSKIFIRNVTVLDCAVWDLQKGPIGRSWHVDVSWVGHTDEEGVVLDFSFAKQLAKRTIDEEFDHRLLVSEKVTRKTSAGRLSCYPHSTTPHDQRFLIETYPSSLAILPQEVLEDLAINSRDRLEDTLAASILARCPKNVRKVCIQLREHEDSSKTFYFNYLHSLKLHSGNCQRFHGHSNTIEVHSNGQLDLEKSSFAAQFLNNKYLVAADYLSVENIEFPESLLSDVKSFEMDSDSFSWVSYMGSQGRVHLRVPKNRLLVMPEESTIENISRWIFETHFAGSENLEVHAFEGLNKGSITP